MDLRSMTGFGGAESSSADSRISVELKSVNSRFLDLNIKMPKCLNALEARIRQRIKTKLARGKVDLYITYEDYSERGRKLRLNMELARAYFEAMQQIGTELGLSREVSVRQIAMQPEVLQLSEEGEEPEALWEQLRPALDTAVQHFVEARTLEGENLGRDLLTKLSEMEELVCRIELRAPEIVANYEKRLRDKVTELLGGSGIEESRIVQEVTVYADKVCTDEELVRLHSHVDNMRKKLGQGGEVGRELDFLAQEMNREANTTLSKANDLIVSEDAIRLKTLIEKIREQVQNLE